ncbi:Mad3/BUB1 homology region 1-domain-containing protein [Syncephalis fuscata]|nr:Mad3/BUB1 homology region 1-domain-containing protein [Syncephalis fuscata]
MAHLLASNRETSSTGVAVKPLESDQINCQNTDDSTSIGTRSFVDPTSKEKGKINASLFHIGDLTDIEKEKENILPVRSGRSVYELVRQFSTPDKKRHSKLQEEREGFETLLTNAHEWDDPLEAYYKFVHWTIDNYPQGNNSESNLVPLLERCTRTFRTDKRYVNDPRYLRCWLMYAEYIAEPRIIFQHLEANGIGQELAAFYEEYAVNLEKESRWQQADAIYKLGINRFAQPLNRLTRKYNAFQVRMAAVGVKLSPTDLVAEQSVAEVSKKPTVERPPMRVFGNAQANTQSNVEVKDALGQHNQRLEVYQDKEDASLPAVANNNTTPWTDLGTEASRHKENRLEPTRWRGQKLSNFGTRLAQPCKKFKVYEDEVNNNNNNNKLYH